MKTLPIATACLALALLAAGGSAIYYHNLAADYETRWSDAMSKLAGAMRTAAPSSAVDHPVILESNNDAQISALLEKLADKEQELETLRSATNRVERTRRDRPERIDWEARIEQMKEENPEQYAAMEARRQEIQNHIQSAFAERASILLNHTPANMTDKEAARRDLMFQTLEETWTLTEQMTSGELTAEERRTAFQTLRENAATLQPLLEEERDRQLYDLGLSSGYSESAAAEFVDYINDTLEATSMGGIGRGRGFGGGPGR